MQPTARNHRFLGLKNPLRLSTKHELNKIIRKDAILDRKIQIESELQKTWVELWNSSRYVFGISISAQKESGQRVWNAVSGGLECV